MLADWPLQSATFARGSFGLFPDGNEQTMRVWFCGRVIRPVATCPHTNIKVKPCAHLTRREARECRKQEV